MSDLHRTPTHPVARKVHRCIACCTDIAQGEKHVAQTGFYDGEAYRNRYHTECFDSLCEGGAFEFSPGDCEPPARITA